MELWNSAREGLARAMPPEQFNNWIKDLEFLSLDGGIAVFEVRTNFVRDWVSTNYSKDILYHLNQIDKKVAGLGFKVKPRGKQSRKNLKPSDSDNVNSKLLPKDRLQLDPRFTFDSLVVGKPNQLAHMSALRMATDDNVDFNPLFLYGNSGLGKTHLMHAIGWALKSRYPNLGIMYLTAEQFMFQFVRALMAKNIIEFKEFFRAVDVLMVDDVHFIADKDSTQEEFFHTFNTLVDQNKRIVLSSDRSPGRIEGLEAKFKSRLQSGLVVDVQPTDFKLRFGILKKKLERHMASSKDLEIPDDVLEFIAHRITSNVRVLEGALNRLVAGTQLIGGPATLEIAEEFLRDIVQDSTPNVTVEIIIDHVAKYYDLKLADLKGPKRQRGFVRPRQIAMHLIKDMTSLSLPDIGREFGGRDHTTVIHSLRKVEELRMVESRISEDLQTLRGRIMGSSGC